jgi:outer membrane protein insertion porin family
MRAALLVLTGLVSPAWIVSQALAQGLPRPGVMVGHPLGQPVLAQASMAGGVISDIRVEGNQRIEAGTVRSYMLVQPGDTFDSDQLDRSLKTLYATGLFSDVSLRREGNTLVVRVAENPIVNRIAFEGNHQLTDENLRGIIALRPRAVFTPQLAEQDRQKILDAYAKKGRFNAHVEPKIIKLAENRVDVVFEIMDGAATYISRIDFVGNHAFSESQLKDVVSAREEAWWRFLSTSDSYDPERVAYDKELLRRFYLKNGYADVEVTSGTGELTPDRSAFFLSFTIHEGPRYKVASVKVNSSLRNLDGALLTPSVLLAPGDWYDGDAIEKSVEQITTEVQNRGFAFVDVKPQIKRDKEKHTVDLVFDVGEGPRVYVERIDINGNVRTKDEVIRREFRVAEGDAFNAALLRRSRQRLEDLNYFNTVTVTSAPGSVADKAVVNVNVQEKATGELTLGGGYSSDAGALLNAGLREKNLIGTGIDAGINGVLAQRQTQFDVNVVDPYFLGNNLVASTDLFLLNNNNQSVALYSEKRVGGSFTLGYEISEHLRQAWTYSIVQRTIYNVQTGASIYVQDEAGQSLLSQIGQTLSLDYRDSKLDPHSGSIIRFGTDFAGLGGDVSFARAKVDGTYFIPLDFLTGNSDWGLAISAGAGQMFSINNKEKIIDRFFLGGDNLRGFQTGGAGPHAINGGDSLGGHTIITQSTELRFPLPVSPDLGLTGRTFVDLGTLFEVPSVINGVRQPVTDNHALRMGAGVGVSWKTPFGLINLDLAPFVIKQHYDQGQIFRFGFGTRF